MRAHFDWREEFLKLCGPGVLSGITARTWFGLLRERGATVQVSRWPRVFSVTLQSLKNSFWARLERERYDSAVRAVVIQPPLFILGHWRSGTTHLHELLSQDKRYGYPNSYQTSFPHTFLTTEQSTVRWLSRFVPRRRPMDNMEMDLSRPQEDEFALCSSTLRSPCLAWVFPRQRRDFEKYLTLESTSAAELAEWREALLWFLKKVQFRCERPLVLKSPPHTARIGLLLEMFPRAKFIHIHRDPYRVIQSSLHCFRIINRWHGLQRLNEEDLENWTLEQYAAMYRAFFSNKSRVPTGQFHEVSYEALEKSPLRELERLYEALSLPGFAEAKPRFEKYLNSVANYQKNSLAELHPCLKERIGRDCRECFERWGYSL